MKRLLLSLLLVAACQEPAATRSWSDGVQARLDAEAAAHDCVALQGEFDQADANRNAGLMEYVDGTMKSAGCYQ